MLVVRLHGRPEQPLDLRRARGDAHLLASGGEHLPVLLVQAKDFQLNCGQFQGLVKLIMAGMDATSEIGFLPLGCLPSVVLGPAVLLLVPGLKPGLAEPPARSP
jgi:hypothetical protein